MILSLWSSLELPELERALALALELERAQEQARWERTLKQEQWKAQRELEQLDLRELKQREWELKQREWELKQREWELKQRERELKQRELLAKGGLRTLQKQETTPPQEQELEARTTRPQEQKPTMISDKEGNEQKILWVSPPEGSTDSLLELKKQIISIAEIFLYSSYGICGLLLFISFPVYLFSKPARSKRAATIIKTTLGFFVATGGAVAATLTFIPKF